ncbi:MAG: sulfotransferase, partial [Myxococcota bacterium]|nr:sulfotransferase [Myxococcota bacterium]
IYAHWDLPLGDHARQRMRDYVAGNPPGRHGKHAYSFADMGLDLDEERMKFAAYQARFDVPSEV